MGRQRSNHLDKPTLSNAVPDQHARAANEIAAQLGRPATLDDMSDDEFDTIARLGFDWVWLLGVWQTGAEARQISLPMPVCGTRLRRRCPT